jgi:zinc transporter 1/2/3
MANEAVIIAFSSFNLFPTDYCNVLHAHSITRNRDSSWLAVMPFSRVDVPTTLLLGALMQFTLPVEAVNGRPTASVGVCDLSSTLEDSVSALRVAAIFIILVASALGIILPFLPQLASSRSANNSKARRFWDETFFVLKYVGAGVIVATAFVHLTYESFVELESPCINLTYKPLAPVLSMASLSVIFLVDCFLTRYLHRLRKRNRERTSKRGELMDEELQMSNVLILGQTAPGSITIPPRRTKEELERAEELDRLEEEALDERSKQMEVAIIEGGIV